jgi:hypothetical protein
LLVAELPGGRVAESIKEPLYNPVILSRRSAAKELKLRGTSHMRRILSSFAVYAAQDDGVE